MEASSINFESLVWLDLELNPGFLCHWRTVYRLYQWLYLGQITEEDLYLVDK